MGYSKAQLLYSFGRVDQLHEDQIRQLVKSLARFLTPAEAVQATAAVDGTPALDFVESRPWGGAWVLEHLWQHLGIQKALESVIQDHAYRTPVGPPE